MSILTVSHEIGAGGPEIGQKVAEQLGWHYVDQELISDAALRYGVLEEKLSSLDESKPSLFERFDAETRHHRAADGGVRVRRAGSRGAHGTSGAVASPRAAPRAAPARDGAVRSSREAPRQEALWPDGRADEPPHRA